MSWIGPEIIGHVGPNTADLWLSQAPQAGLMKLERGLMGLGREGSVGPTQIENPTTENDGSYEKRKATRRLLRPPESRSGDFLNPAVFPDYGRQCRPANPLLNLTDSRVEEAESAG